MIPTPWLSWPRRLASTRWPATISASAGSLPPAAKMRTAKSWSWRWSMSMLRSLLDGWPVRFGSATVYAPPDLSQHVSKPQEVADGVDVLLRLGFALWLESVAGPRAQGHP